MGKKIKLEQAKAIKLAEGEVLAGIYRGSRVQNTKYGDRTLHAFELEKPNGEHEAGATVELWGTALLDKSPQLAAAVGKRVQLTKLNEGDRGQAVNYELEIG